MGIVIDIIGSVNRGHRQSRKLKFGPRVAKQAIVGAIRWQNKRSVA